MPLAFPLAPDALVIPLAADLVLEGEVIALQQLTAPFSRRPCVLYQLELPWLQRLRERRLRGPTREVAGMAFVLRWREQELVVDPSQARLHWARACQRFAPPAGTSAANELLAGLYRRLDRPRPRGAIVLGERRLEPGDRITVTGALVELAHPAGQPAGYRLPPRLRLLQATELWLAGGATEAVSEGHLEQPQR